ncbi:hypothetical protein A2U01_0066059 [Trifolium medium]|uniref:Uncharacterized protein n=1 Tax=Trifolium medium TaxID=97028 RepID=A0A392SA23_9FABA|nr:hypothetical protein [Trifolium medium]
MARCAGRGIIVESTSGCCVSRSLGWRIAPLKQVVERILLDVARRAGWGGAMRHYKIQAEMVVTDTCASR